MSARCQTLRLSSKNQYVMMTLNVSNEVVILSCGNVMSKKGGQEKVGGQHHEWTGLTLNDSLRKSEDRKGWRKLTDKSSRGSQLLYNE